MGRDKEFRRPSSASAMISPSWTTKTHEVDGADDDIGAPGGEAADLRYRERQQQHHVAGPGDECQRCTGE